MPRLVLDASALLAYLNDEPGGSEIEKLLLDEASECLVHAVNIIEVYYRVARNAGKHLAEEMLADLERAGVQVREDLDDALRRTAGDLRVLVLDSSGPRRGSIADCLCAALAEREGCPVVTSDVNDFAPLVEHGRCVVRTFR